MRKGDPGAPNGRRRAVRGVAEKLQQTRSASAGPKFD